MVIGSCSLEVISLCVNLHPRIALPPWISELAAKHDADVHLDLTFRSQQLQHIINMSLRGAVLNAALPHVNRTSFTRRALVDAMRSLPSSSTVANATETPVLDASPSASTSAPPAGLTSSSPESAETSDQGLSETAAENALDVLFGPGLAPARALVDAWCAQGLAQMTPGGGSRRVDEVLFDPLSRRLWHSASAGNSLLDAHALLATNHTVGPSSIPIPPGATTLLQTFSNILPLPGSRAGPYGANTEINTMTALNLGRIPTPPNPLAGVQYAWQIADRAVNVARPNRGKGEMREDRGFGTEWYATRVAVMMAYLEAGE